MRTADFLKIIWPSQGHYCVAQPKSNGDRSWWQHASFDTQDAAVERLLQVGQLGDVYFTVLSLREPFIIDRNKIDKAHAEGRKITEYTGRVYRSHANIAWARSYFIDLDVGKTDGYPTQQVAFEALKAFCRRTGLPKPWIVSSGVGLHVYWPMDADVPADEWRVYATKLKALCQHAELKADPVRTADVASVLRPPGTSHFKDPDNPRRVTVAQQGAVTSFADWCAIVDRAYQLTPTGTTHEGEPLASTTPVTIVQLRKACALVDSLVARPADVSEPKWYKLLGIVKFVEDGTTVAHEASKGHPDYTAEETNKKLAQLDRRMPDGSTLGPTTCMNMAETCGPAHCQQCWFSKTTFYRDGASSPIVAARRLPLDEVVGVPPAPFPYLRTSGGIMIEGGDAPQVICPYDFYPIASIEDQQSQTRASRWAIHLPRKPKRELLIPNVVVNDAHELSKYLADNAFVAAFDEVKGIKTYMTHYLRELQKHVDDHQQYGHLGWTKDQRSFVMPEGELRQGEAKSVMLSTNAMHVGGPIHRRGELRSQVKALRFYTDPAFVGHQFMIAASLAAPLFFITDQYGTVVNMTGKPGSSKSTALRIASSMWGRPDQYMVSGTDNGATVKGRNAQIATLQNLPMCIDEITLMHPDDIRQMIMGFTQFSAEPIRLKSNTEFRQKVSENGKSTLMLCTSNNSMHEVLSHRNAAGSAGSMRLFEIMASPPSTTKAEAEVFIEAIKANYGHVGYEWMTWVTAHLDEITTDVRAEMRRLDALLQMEGAERFWSAVAAVTIYTTRTAARLGFLPFDADAMERWLIDQQFPLMRAIVTASYDSHIDTLLSYLASVVNRMALTMDSKASNQRVVEKAPSGELAGCLRTDAGIATVLVSDLRAWAGRERIQINAMLQDLTTKGIVRRMRTDPVAGTIFAIGPQPCIVIDLNHPAISLADKDDKLSNVIEMRRRG